MLLLPKTWWVVLIVGSLGPLASPAPNTWPADYDGTQWVAPPPAPRAAGVYWQTNKYEIMDRRQKKPFERRATSVPGTCTIDTPSGALASVQGAAVAGPGNVAFSGTFPVADLNACVQVCQQTACCVIAFFRGFDNNCRTGVTSRDPIQSPPLTDLTINNQFVFVGLTCDNVRNFVSYPDNKQCVPVSP